MSGGGQDANAGMGSASRYAELHRVLVPAAVDMEMDRAARLAFKGKKSAPVMRIWTRSTYAGVTAFQMKNNKLKLTKSRQK